MTVIYMVEGADGTGKTAFIERVVAGLAKAGAPQPRMIHNDATDASLPGSLYHHYRAQLLDAVDFRNQGISTFIDRGFLSEFIYGSLYRGRSRITPRQARKLEALAVRHGILLLGLTAQQSHRRARLEARGEIWNDDYDPFVGLMYDEYFQRHDRWTTADSSSAALNN